MCKKLFILIASILTFIAGASAQKMSIGFIYPAGGMRGTSVDIEIGGLNIREASGVVISGEGVTGKIIPLNQKKNPLKGSAALRGKLADQSSPQLAERIGVRVTISSKASPGLRDLRLRSAKGVSNKLFFEVGQYPNVLEKSGSSVDTPVGVNQLPATLCGQILPGEVDFFSFKAEKGMKLVAETKGRILVPFIADAVPGWFQPVMRLINSHGIEVAYNDDYRNSPDPVILTTIPETDTYILSIRDAIYRGREDFNYRISLGEIPFIEYLNPCASKTGEKLEVSIEGVNLGHKKVKFKPGMDGYNEISVKGKNDYFSSPAIFWGISKNNQVSYFPSGKEKLEPDVLFYDSVSSRQPVKSYLISAKKNETIAVGVRARRLGSMLDAKLTLRELSGRKLAEADDVEDPTQGLMTHHADPMLQYKVNRTGDYLIEVTDVMGKSGPDWFYLIERIDKIPEFQTFVSPAVLTVPRGGTAFFKVEVVSPNKTVTGMKFEMKGLPEGFLVSSLQSQPGNKAWEISVTAPESAKEGQFSPEVVVHPLNAGKGVSSYSQVALPADNMMQAFYYTHLLPAAGFVAEITPPSAFSLRLSDELEKKIQDPILVSSSDTIVPVKIRIHRTEGFRDTIDLELNRKNPMITLDPIKVLPEETEKTIILKINGTALQKVRQARVSLSIVGTVNSEIDRVGKRSFQNAKYREYSPLFVLQKKPVL